MTQSARHSSWVRSGVAVAVVLALGLGLGAFSSGCESGSSRGSTGPGAAGSGGVESPATGGAVGSGGFFTGSGGSAGGAVGTGGTPSDGGQLTGGTPSSGGRLTGGTPSLGGASGAGGVASTGGTFGSGGVGSGGAGSGGTGTGGARTGGDAGSGGTGTGGARTGGAATTGRATGIAGGAMTGGTAAGGTSAGTSTGPCGTHSWACWPMPNPVSMGLANPASYTDLGDGTVRDNVTSLVWQKTVSSSTYASADATTYCAGLALPGSGWRVPTRIELESITDHTRTSPAINVTAFPGTPAAFFLTSTPWAVRTPPVWGTNFYEGLSSNNVTPPARVRCVRGNGDGDLPATPPPNQYTVVATGEVQDNYTKLIWEQATHQPAMDFATASALCSGLALNGHSFRLPTVNELSTLVDDRRVAPAINQTMFPDTVWGSGDQYYYWAQDAWAGSTAGTGWGLNYNDGYTGHGRLSLVVRCVRS